MLYPTLTVNLITFGSIALLLNLISFVPFFAQKPGRSIRDNPSHLPLVCLLLCDVGLSLILIAPIHSFLTEKGIFDETWCIAYGATDMFLSLSQVVIASIIAFDRYIVTIAPKWGKWRCHSNYIKTIFIIFLSCFIWSFVPILGYGKYSVFHQNTFCSLDWRQGNIDPASPESAQEAHRYIAFLTATCLIFFLIPVCIASSFYYSIIDHVDRINSTEAREELGPLAQDTCTWTPKNHVAKIGLGCLLVSTLPYLAYSIVCLNPMKSDFRRVSAVVVPVIISRFSALLNPIFYVWCNPELVPVEEFVAARLAARRPQKTYNTIRLIADVPGMSFPILTPTVPRRQLPQIPPHLVSPSTKPNKSFFDDETQPML